MTMPRSKGAAVLAVPLLAVLVLAGLGVAAGLHAGGRAERARGLVPFTDALTALVTELQRERGGSGAQATGSGQGASAGGELAAARRAVDGAAAAYRNAAVRLDVSDRDRQLHRRLDAGLAQLAELQALRASVDGGAGTTDATAAATVFRRYTGIIGGLLAVGGEIGLREAGQDAELLRAVTAATAFSRAKELADREREAAVRAAALGRLDPSERVRLAALGGRQDALIDQFGALASQAQLQRAGSAIPLAEAERAGRLRRAALEGGSAGRPGPDLAGWSEAATARVERMGEIEPGLNGEVARLAGLADQAADRRTLAYGTAFALALCSVAALFLVASARARRASGAGAGLGQGPPRRAAVPVAPAPEPVRRPRREGAVDSPAPVPSPLATLPTGGPSALVGGPGVEPERSAEPGAVTGLVDLARRGQDLVDQQLELLGQVGHDHADPRLPGRLLQVDRLAFRARRNAHNLVVLAGGEPSRRWDGPAPLAEVVAVAVRDNRDAPRVDVLVADDLLVPAAAADDLANLLGELVDNAIAFSAPETRVRISGQKVGSGYVLEIEDRGLGMTDGELEAVNRRLAGHREAGDDREQRLGTWVAGRLAERRGVKVQLRRSAYGGVTALVFVPEHLAAARPATPQVDRRGTEASNDPPGDRRAARQAEDAALARLPLRRYVTQVPEGGPEGPLPKRAPNTSLAPDLAAAGDTGRAGGPEPSPAARSPEEVRSMLSRYRSGLERGRAAAARDLPDDPEDDPPA